MLTSVRLLFIFFLSSHLHTSNGQYTEIPEISCPNYFQYLNLAGTIIGQVTLYNIKTGTTTVDVHFSQQHPLQSNYYGTLTLYEDQQTTIKNIQNGQPVTYRVDFPTAIVLPKLTQIAIDGRVICASSDYQPPSTSLKLQHTLSVKIERRVQQFISNYDKLVSVAKKAYSAPKQNSLQNYYSQTQPQIQYTKPNSVVEAPAYVPQRVFTRGPAQPDRAPSRAGESSPQYDSSPPIQSQNANSVCGKEGSQYGKFTPFIHGGTRLRRGEYPWLTAIYGKETTGRGLICGGSLISSRTVLTAAHCIEFSGLRQENMIVYLGRYNLTNTYEEQYERREIVGVAMHPEYSSGISFPDADLALVYMSSPVRFTENIKPICLWSEPDDQSIIVGKTAMVAGWGLDEYNYDAMIPKKSEADVVSESECLHSSPGYDMITSPRTLCAGKRDDSGPCTGDSGGGLIMNRDGRWVLRGVVSAGQLNDKHCNLREYVVYCDVAKHMKWVRKNMV